MPVYEYDTNSGVLNAPIISFPTISGLTINGVAPSQVDIPLDITSYTAPSRRPAVNDVTTIPVMIPDQNLSIGGHALSIGSTQLPKITLEGHIDTPMIEPTYNLPAGVTNLVTNPSFEQSTADYGAAGATSRGLSTDRAYSGTKSFKWTSITLADQNSGNAYIDTISFPVTAGEQVDARAYVYYPRSGPGIRVNIFWSTGANAQADLTTVANTWNELKLGAVAPAGATNFSIRIWIANNGVIQVGDSIYLDAVSVFKNWPTTEPLPPYFDGSHPEAYWNGTAHASSSSTYPKIARSHIVVNGIQLTYADLIAMYIEGRASSSGWSRVNPISFRDPYGRVYNSPKLLDFSANYVEAIPGRTSFMMQLKV